MWIEYDMVFESGWRIGSGEGAGHLADARVRTDGLGLPFVPGSTVRGLVRDALGVLADPLGLDLCTGTLERTGDGVGTLCGVNRDELCPRCALTGSPHRPGGVGWGAARLDLGEAAREPRRRRQLAAQAVAVPDLLTRARPRTAIDPRSGRAEDEHLFVLEEARPGVALAGRLELDPALTPREVALLLAALRFLREAGGGRRRGLGACRVEITAADLRPAFSGWRRAVRSLAGGGPEPPAEPAPTLGHRPTATAGTAPAPDLPAPILQVTATVVGEVVAGGRPESGNLISGLPHLPGSTLRGALAARWRGDRDAEDFHRCFLSGAVRFGFLHPLAGQRTALPLPLSVHSCKERPGEEADFGHGLVDLLGRPRVELCPQPGCDARLAPWGPRFDGTDDADRPPLLLSPHNRVDPASQTVGAQSLFAYEALPEGTRLRGFVRADGARELDLLLRGLGLGGVSELAAAPLHLELRAGRRKGTLGHLDCELTPFPGVASEVGLFPDAPALPTEPGTVRIDLLTPAILEDRHLRHRCRLLPSDLGLDRPAFDATFAATESIAGWNAAHRLPKADEVAIAAGSSYLLGTATAEELERLRTAARHGVGRRRTEGFGAFAVKAADASPTSGNRPERRSP